KLPILRAEKDVISGRGDGVAKYYFVRILLRQTFGERLPGFSIITAPIYTKLALAREALPVRIQRDDENRAVVTDSQPKPEIRGQPFLDLLPRRPAVSTTINAVMILQKKQVLFSR